MNEFDLKAAEWDNNPMHTRRSEAVAEAIRASIPLTRQMKALEFGAGTGTTGFILSGELGHITLSDSSEGMMKVMEEKIRRSGIPNLLAVHSDLETILSGGNKYDLVFSQMTLHHIRDTEAILRKVRKILNNNGFLAIADLYAEDGSFHGKGADVHSGFDPDALSRLMERTGYMNIAHRKCFTIEKMTEGGLKEFDVFLITSQSREK